MQGFVFKFKRSHFLNTVLYIFTLRTQLNTQRETKRTQRTALETDYLEIVKVQTKQ